MIRHPVAWGVWTLAALAAVFIDRNPYVQALLLLTVINVYLPYRGRRQASTWKFGLALAIVPILFSAALSRFGRHLLFTLPPIPIIGGRWTLDAVAFGASTGLALLLTVAVFAVLQSTVRSADVVAILPRPLYRAGTTVALALAFAPKTLAAFQSIREARQLRGQRTGWRAAPALLLPLLLTTLERALQYGESLDGGGSAGCHRLTGGDRRDRLAAGHCLQPVRRPGAGGAQPRSLARRRLARRASGHRQPSASGPCPSSRLTLSAIATRRPNSRP